jgi:phosphoribosylformimino-5-aminoimidazole carboxamide ribotide isomerase
MKTATNTEKGKMRIIPAIDIMGGKCVRLTNGNFDTQVVYNHNPMEVALEFEGAGLQFLHLVDLDGARQGKVVNWKTLEHIAARTSLQIDFSGGLRSVQDLKVAFGSGAAKITAGSIAIDKPEEVYTWLDLFGADAIITGADVNNRKIATRGWAETTGMEITQFIDDFSRRGFQTFMCTDIAKDGMLEGPAIQLYHELCSEFPKCKIIASGGVSNIGDLEKLAAIGLHGAIVGKALYEGKINLKELSALC